MEWEETNQLETQLQWRRGDIALGLKPNPGERIEQTLKAFAGTVHVEFETLRVYRWVAQQYERVVRTTLSWSHHERIAARADRLDWLEKAANDKWSVARMLEEIAADDAEKVAEEEERQLLARPAGTIG